jgi:endoplasmic reticulum Man9GlcNAc2 1,2-alpha-mannosidase
MSFSDNWSPSSFMSSGPILRSRITLKHIIYTFLGLFVTWTLYSSLILRDSGPDYSQPYRPTVHVGGGEPRPPATTWPGKAEAVKDAFRHAYHGWEKYAAPADELLPNSARKVNKYITPPRFECRIRIADNWNSFNGWGVTMFDSLDTMILMDLKPELERAIPMVKAATFEMKGVRPFPFPLL